MILWHELLVVFTVLHTNFAIVKTVCSWYFSKASLPLNIHSWHLQCVHDAEGGRQNQPQLPTLYCGNLYEVSHL